MVILVSVVVSVLPVSNEKLSTDLYEVQPGSEMAQVRGEITSVFFFFLLSMNVSQPESVALLT